MREGIRRWLLAMLRVPPEPHPPSGGTIVRVFRAAPNYLRYVLVRWALGQAVVLAGLIGSFVLMAVVEARADQPIPAWILTAAAIVAWGIFLVQLPISYGVTRLDFDLRWYILSDRSLRIREGILEVREKTITFANIQQISIRQNPLQRVLGIADVQVTTAGGGSGGGEGKPGAHGESMHEAYFRGVDNAEEIRSLVRERVRLYQDAGLGDPDDPAPALESPAEPDVLPAARELRDEMRALRVALGGRAS